MRSIRCIAVCAALLLAATPAAAQSKSQPAKPYKPVTVVLPQPMADEGFDAMRKQLGEAAQHKDRAALARLVVAQGFFWQRDGRNVAEKRKSGFDILAAALGLNNKESAGWEILSGYAEDPVASPSPNYKGAMCAPAEPGYDRKALADLIKATNSDVTEWGYTLSAGLAVRAAPQNSAPVVDTLGFHFVHILPETASDPPSYMRIATPAGKTGYVLIDSIAPIGNDQICYVKDGAAWKIGGYVGGGEPQ
jgi:hypothetical protein